MGWRIQVGLGLSAVGAFAACLEPPLRGDPHAAPDGGASAQPSPPDAGVQPACTVSVTYASELRVGGEGNFMSLGGLAVIGNVGDVMVDLGDLRVESVTDPAHADLSVELDVATDLLPPGQAHGALDRDVVDAVAPEVTETWTDDAAPTLSLVFDGHMGFDESDAVITLALGATTIPLPMHFSNSFSPDDSATAGTRTMTPCH